MSFSALLGQEIPYDGQSGAVGVIASFLQALERGLAGANHSQPISVTAAATLTSSAFGKAHVCSGTSADYTVTLPMPVAADVGKTTAFRMSDALTKLVTLDAGATRLIGEAQTRACRRGETVLLLCVATSGVCWAVIADAAPTVPAARVYNSAAQACTHNNWTTLTFNSERFDTDQIHDTSSNTSRLTCRTPGKYLVFASAQIAANATGNRFIHFLFNGTKSIGGDGKSNMGAGQAVYMSTLSVYQFAVGDYVELRIFQDSGVSLNTVVNGDDSVEFGMVRIG